VAAFTTEISAVHYSSPRRTELWDAYISASRWSAGPFFGAGSKNAIRSLERSLSTAKECDLISGTTARVAPSSRLTLKDRLSRLTFPEACKLLGPDGAKLIQHNGNTWDFELQEDVFLGDDLFRLRFPELASRGEPVIVTITLMAQARGGLHFRCNACRRTCDHVGAAFSLILEEKLALGLAAAPTPRVPVESLGEDELVQRALSERKERARAEKMRVQPLDPTRPWTDYVVTNRLSGKTHRRRAVRPPWRQGITDRGRCRVGGSGASPHPGRAISLTIPPLLAPRARLIFHR
jgi:hypothetical protein